MNEVLPRALVLCEDRRHWHFIRAFLEARGWNTRKITLRISPSGRGSAEQWVRETYAAELKAYRAKRRENRVLIVMIDGDGKPPNRRIDEINRSDAMHSKQMQARLPGERVAIFVPDRNLETWMAYIEGVYAGETRDYKLQMKNASPAETAKALAYACKANRPLADSPPSLAAACLEWRRLTA